jgi:hypothetical protein
MIAHEIRKNLIFEIFLNKIEFSQTIGADFYIITKNDTFVGKWYASYDMFKLNVKINIMPPSVYSLCDFNI